MSVLNFGSSILETRWLVSALLVLLTIYIFRFFQDRSRYPSGPFPLPIIGNLYLFFTKTRYELVNQFQSKYGDVFTIWSGVQPIVYITGWKYIKEALVTKKDTFSGRPKSDIVDAFVNHRKDIVFADPSPKRELLRKIAFSAIRKYVSSPKLEETVLHVTDAELDEILSHKGPLDPKDEMDFIIMNIVANTAFGKKYRKDDQEYMLYANFFDAIGPSVAKTMLGELLPFLKPFFSKGVKEMEKISADVLDRLTKIYQDHGRAFDGTIRDFTDAVISAKLEADPEDAVLSTVQDQDLSMIIYNLFGAGVDTTRTSMTWTLLFLALNPRCQEKAAKEIQEAMQGNLPTAADRDRCPYVIAILKETLRMRSPVPFGLSQKALYNTTLGEKRIPAGTVISFAFDSVHFDSSHWKDPHQFRPERFVENPDLTKSHYMPFSLGRRSCIGEKMAINQMFLILARFLQRCSFSLVGQADVKPVESAFFSKPEPYSLQFKRRVL